MPSGALIGCHRSPCFQSRLALSAQNVQARSRIRNDRPLPTFLRMSSLLHGLYMDDNHRGRKRPTTRFDANAFAMVCEEYKVLKDSNGACIKHNLDGRRSRMSTVRLAFSGRGKFIISSATKLQASLRFFPVSSSISNINTSSACFPHALKSSANPLLMRATVK